MPLAAVQVVAEFDSLHVPEREDAEAAQPERELLDLQRDDHQEVLQLDVDAVHQRDQPVDGSHRSIGRFFTDDADGTAEINRNTDPLSTPPKNGYHPAYDRAFSPVGPNAWDLAAPDGLIRISDVIHVIKQFFHDCA